MSKSKVESVRLEEIYSKLPNKVVAQVMTGITNDLNLSKGVDDNHDITYTESHIRKQAFLLGIKKPGYKMDHANNDSMISFRR